MELVIGGSYQGKLKYALEYTGLDESMVSDGEWSDIETICTKPILNHFHRWVRALMEQKADLKGQVELLLERNPNIVIIADELGCGIVPMEPFEREYRETAGRCCCQLAERAIRVHRVICGLGTEIKR